MAQFNRSVITNQGMELAMKLLAGKSTTFTKSVTSAIDIYYLSDEALRQMTTISNVVQSVDVGLVDVVDNETVSLSVVFDNKNVTTGYRVRVVGVYAIDPDIGEILYSISLTNEPDFMPPFDGSSISAIDFDFVTTVKNSENVVINVNSNVYATIDQLEDLKKRMDEMTGTDLQVRLELKEFEARVSEKLDDRSFIDGYSGVGLIEDFGTLNKINMNDSTVEVFTNPYNYANFPKTRVVQNEVLESVTDSTSILLKDPISVGDTVNTIHTVESVSRDDLVIPFPYNEIAYPSTYSVPSSHNGGVILENGWKVVVRTTAWFAYFHVDKGDGFKVGGYLEKSPPTTGSSVPSTFDVTCVGNVIYFTYYAAKSSGGLMDVKVVVFDGTKLDDPAVNIGTIRIQDITIYSLNNEWGNLGIECEVRNGRLYHALAAYNYTTSGQYGQVLRFTSGRISDSGSLISVSYQNLINDTFSTYPYNFSLAFDKEDKPVLFVTYSGMNDITMYYSRDESGTQSNSWLSRRVGDINTGIGSSIQGYRIPGTEEFVISYINFSTKNLSCRRSLDNGVTWSEAEVLYDFSSERNSAVLRSNIDSEGSIFLAFSGLASLEDFGYIRGFKYKDGTWSDLGVTHENTLKGKLANAASIGGYSSALIISKPYIVVEGDASNAQGTIVIGEHLNITERFRATLNSPITLTEGDTVQVVTRSDSTLIMDSVDTPNYSKMALKLHNSGMSNIEGNVESGILNVTSMRASILGGDMVCDSEGNTFNVVSTSGEYFIRGFYHNLPDSVNTDTSYSKNTHRNIVELADGTWVTFMSTRVSSTNIRVTALISQDSGITWVTKRIFNYPVPNVSAEMILDVSMIPNTNSALLAVGIRTNSTGTTAKADFICFDYKEGTLGAGYIIRSETYSTNDFPLDLSVGANADGVVICGQVEPRSGGGGTLIRLFAYSRSSPSSGEFINWGNIIASEANSRGFDRLTVQNVENGDPLVIATNDDTLACIRPYNIANLQFSRTYKEFKIYGSKCDSNISTSCHNNEVFVTFANTEGDILLGSSTISDDQSAGEFSQFMQVGSGLDPSVSIDGTSTIFISYNRGLNMGTSWIASRDKGLTWSNRYDSSSYTLMCSIPLSARTFIVPPIFILYAIQSITGSTLDLVDFKVSLDGAPSEGSFNGHIAHLTPSNNNVPLSLVKADDNSFQYEGSYSNVDVVNLKVTGRDTRLKKIVYAIG